MTMRTSPVILAACFAAILPDADGASAAEDHAEMVAGMVAGHIVPRYEALRTATGRLERAVSAACNAGRSPAGDRVQSAYREALFAWMGVQHLRFGPAMADDRFYRYQYWPDKHGQGAKQMRRLLAGPADRIPGPERIAETSVAVQGFPALERLTFPPAGAKTGERRVRTCRLATSITGNLTSMTAEAVREWGAFEPRDARETISRIIRAAVEQLQVVSSLKLGRPMGKSLKKARPRRAESWRSGTSLENIRRNYLALRELIDGSGKWKGLRPSLTASKERIDSADALSRNLSYGSGAIAEHGLSLADSVKRDDGRKFVTFLIAHTDGIRDIVVDDIAPALGVELGFNEQDGD